MSATTLLAVPNISEGRDRSVIEEIARALNASLLDIHSDPDHNRSVYTLAARAGQLAPAVLAGAAEALRHIDIRRHDGVHPRVGAIDVAPIVYMHDGDRGAACAEALVLGDLLGDELELPVFLYGALAQGRARAELRRGGPAALEQKLAAGELAPDFGPRRLHHGAGAVLVGARAPLIALNVELAPPASLQDAQAIAARVREGGGEGLQSVRAIGVWLKARGVAQVSTNIEDHHATPPAKVIDAVRRHARPAGAELVGLAPRAALEGLPADLPLRGIATIEDELAVGAPSAL